MGLLHGTESTGVIVRTPDENDLKELSHLFIDSIYHYIFGDDYVLVKDFQFTIDELVEKLTKDLDNTGLYYTLTRNEI